MYYNGRKVYRRFIANGQPTPPVFDGKWKATYSNGNVTKLTFDKFYDTDENGIPVVKEDKVDRLKEYKSIVIDAAVTLPNNLMQILRISRSQSKNMIRLRINPGHLEKEPVTKEENTLSSIW